MDPSHLADLQQPSHLPDYKRDEAGDFPDDDPLADLSDNEAANLMAAMVRASRRPNDNNLAIGVCDECADCFWVTSPGVISGARLCGKTCRKRVERRRARMGQRKVKRGYVLRYFPDHPNAPRSGWLREHRRVMAAHIGRPLREWEGVHHRDGNRSNNEISNLELTTLSHFSGVRVRDLVTQVVSLYRDAVRSELEAIERSEAIAASTAVLRGRASFLPPQEFLGRGHA